MKNQNEKKLPSPFELFGLEIGKGWLPLVDPILLKIEELNSHGANIKIEQIKEKWGMLSVYLSDYPDELEIMIKAAEEQSTHTCMNCGKPAQRVWGNQSWIYTLCPECLAARKIKVRGPVEARTILPSD